MAAKFLRNLLVLFTGLFLAQAALAQQKPTREISKIAGDVYRFRNNFHYSVFMVTPQGIVVTDPIDPDAAAWLKNELKKRFNKPIKYLIYSHDHADHIAGGEVFADSAVVIAHVNAKKQIIGEKRPTAVPQLTFSDRMELELGRKRLELIYLGKNHSDNLVLMRFPEERILFAVDIVARRRLPYRDLTGVYIDEWIESLKLMENMDFDILAPGHGELGTKADVRDNRRYLEELRGQVLKFVRAGKPLKEIQQLVTMDEYKDWSNYGEWLKLNIEGMYRHLALHPRPN